VGSLSKQGENPAVHGAEDVIPTSIDELDAHDPVDETNAERVVRIEDVNA